ncbi:saccharopine dehydrogenase family protein, partial [Helicobacter magdeburgensis]
IAQSLTSSKLNRDFLDNPQTSSTILECQDSSNMKSQKVDSAPCHTERSEASSLESYNAERLKLNADMPKGGEHQGIDSSSGSGVWNMEQNDPDPFMCELNKQGLPYIVCEIESNGSLKVLEDGRG